MHPFDFPADVITLTGNCQDYFAFINNKYFSICQNQRVLEIGPFGGKHSKLIINNAPSYFETIEGDAENARKLSNIIGIDNIIHNDVIVELQENSKQFDVCVCFGVLYHLHSPLHLIELIINKCQPRYLLLDCVMAPHPLVFLDESINTPGNCQTVKEWKSCKLNLVIPFFIYNQSLYNMGYKLELVNQQTVSWRPKSNGWTAMWKLQE
jgi:SAM-dependent methyltransferase